MDCIFCRIIKKEIPSKAVFDDDILYAFEDVNPQAPVHILIVPKIHISTLLKFTLNDAALIGQMILCATQLARQKKIADPGFRTVFNCNAQAGQTVFHVHLHLLGGRDFGWPPG